MVGVIDGPPEARYAGFPERGCSVVGPEAFGIDEAEYLRMATAYTVLELATAVKPYLLRALRREHEVAIYLDPDIQVFAPMPELVELARAHQLVLTPHFLRPLPRDGKEPGEAVIMGTGLFNLGFLATGPGCEEFLDFWADRLRMDAVVAPDEQLFTDQRWVDQVPSLFGHHVLRDPGYNVAYWNTHERPIERAESGEYTAAGVPLRFFHFSGYRPEKPWLLSFHCSRRPRTLLSEHPVLGELCAGYGTALAEAGYADPGEESGYGFGALADGTRLTPLIRRLFRTAWLDYERGERGAHGTPQRPPMHGFGADGGAALVRWLAEPPTAAHAAAGISRLAMAIWGSRADLRAAFGDPTGVDAANFRQWCRDSGPKEVALPPWACPAEPASLAPPDDEFGVNVVGYLTAELGLGEMGRIVHDALTAAEVPVVSVVEDRAVHNRTGLPAPETVGEPRFPVSLLCVNADQTGVVLDNHPTAGYRRYRIGLWAWELDKFPGWLHDAFAAVDEVWTVSEFCRQAIARHSSVDVHTIPVPVPDVGKTAPHRRRQDPIQFLFAFDFNSVGERKNPWGTVEAFRRAFPDPHANPPARLVLKAINGERNPHAAERLRMAVATDPRIELIDRYLDTAELHQLYANSHCYVSLHRSEGFGLTIAEAMMRGMPVIATDYSGSAEFLDERTGWPIPYTMVEVGHGCFPYQADAHWAQPDVDTAARAMRQIAEYPEEAAKRGWAAREKLLRARSTEEAARWFGQRLAAAYESWQGGAASTAAEQEVAEPLESAELTEHTDSPDSAEQGKADGVEGVSVLVEDAEPAPADEPAAEVPDDGAEAGPALREPLDPLRAARERLHQRPTADDPARNPLAPALRKLVLRSLDHYDAHQRGLLDALADGTEDTAVRLRERIEALERRLDALEASTRVDELATELTAAATRASRTEDSVRELAEHTDTELAALGQRFDKGQHDANVRQQHTIEMFAERDRRTDAMHTQLDRVQLDLDPLYRAAPLRHAPVPAGTEVVLCDAGALLVPRDDVFLPWLRHHRGWEEDEASLMATLAGDGFVLDIGAHVGYHTIRLVRDCPEIAGVLAVEANEHTALLLERNLRVNLPEQAARGVSVLPVAAWDQDATVRLAQQEAHNSGDYRVWQDGEPGAGVRGIRLDGLPELGEVRVGLVKVDLQGRDHRALAGLVGVLRRDHPQVVCEFAPEQIRGLGDDPELVLRGYRDLGYQPGPIGAAEREYTDAELIAEAEASVAGFSTLWLRPSSVTP